MAYTQCCAPLHAGSAAPNALLLMRSRYCAYVLKLEDYLLATWHASTRPGSLDLAQDSIKWLGLQVAAFSEQSDQAQVRFVARYKIHGKADKMEENSLFVKEAGRWFYLRAID